MSRNRFWIGLGVSVLLAGCESSPPPAPSATAPELKPVVAPPPAAPKAPWDGPVDGRPVFMKVRAEGVQIYQCKKDASGAYAWKWVAPEALLYNDKGRAIGKHGAGPSFELQDGSKVVAEVVGENPAPGAVPSLLLKATSSAGKGKLSVVKYIKRVETDGGLPPTMVADASLADKEERVPYRATYLFYAGN